MLTAIRDFAKSWPARILMGILALSFVGWGANSVGVSMIPSDHVIKAGSRSINAAEFRREYDNYKKRLEQQSGQPIMAEMAEENRLDAAVLQGVATREAFAELLRKAGVRPSDKLVLDQIQKIPAFFDPISGRFDRKTFTQRLSETGLRPEDFDGVLRDEMAAQHWAVSIQNGLAVPRAYGALASVFALESRDLSYLVLTPASVPQPAAPTDAQLQAFINENKTALTVPETRVLTIVPFTPQAAQAEVAAAPIAPAEMQKRYEFRKDTLSKPETRTIVQIPAKDQAAAQAAVGRLQRGEAPAAVARSLGVDAITYEEKPLTAIADRKVGQAAFRMQAGQVGAVQGDLGLAVVKVVSVTEGREVSLEEARPMLEAEIRKDMVAEKVYAQSQAYDDAHQAGASLADAAAKAGVAAQTLGPISAQGVDEQGRQYQIPPKILETAFALPSGGESELTDLGDGAYFAVKVERIAPAHVPPLAEIRGRVTQVYMQRAVIRALEAKADELAARLKKGEAIDAVAASAGVPVGRLPGLTRQTAQQSGEALGREVLARAFSAKPGEAWMARAPNGLVVGQVANIRMDLGPTAARLAETNRGELTQAVFREMADAAQAYARVKLKVKVDAAKARAAAGFAPEEKAAPGKAEKKK